MPYKPRDEKAIMEAIQAQFSKGRQRLFRNEIGTVELWRGGPFKRFGVGHIGGADLIGWRSIKVTPDLVGTTIAVFAAIEVKDGDYPATPKQKKFLATVRAAGGRAGIARSVAEAKSILIK